MTLFLVLLFGVRLSTNRRNVSVNSDVTTFNLDANLDSKLGSGQFIITLTATNLVGISPESNMVQYEPKQGEPWLDMCSLVCGVLSKDLQLLLWSVIGR